MPETKEPNQASPRSASATAATMIRIHRQGVLSFIWPRYHGRIGAAAGQAPWMAFSITLSDAEWVLVASAELRSDDNLPTLGASIDV